MELDRRRVRGRKVAPFAQVGLAALVAGSMLTFSALAFRTGILDDGARGVRPTTRSAAGGRPVVLPAATPKPEVAARRERRVPDRILVSELDPNTNVVLGTKIEPTDDTAAKRRGKQDHGDGHDKARGKGHHKKKGKGHDGNHEAKEDDDGWDGHAPDDDDDDDDDSESSRSRSGHRSRGRSGGSKDGRRGNLG